MTDHELVRELRSTSLLNRVRQLLSQSAGRIDQAYRQRRHPSPVEIRRMEFEDAQKIIDLVISETQAEQERSEVVYGCGFEISPNEFSMFAGPNPSFREMLDFNVDDWEGISGSAQAFIIRFEGEETTKVAEWDRDNEVWVEIEDQQ